MTGAYDEERLRESIDALSRPGRVALAAAAAERLLPLFRLYASRARHDEQSVALRNALDEVWSGVITGQSSADSRAGQTAESLVPSDDDPGWISESAFAQNAAAAVAYAFRVWDTDDPQQVIWALRQAVEAVDYAYSSRPEIVPRALVDHAVEIIQQDCALAASRTPEELRARSAADDSWGEVLARSW